MRSFPQLDRVIPASKAVQIVQDILASVDENIRTSNLEGLAPALLLITVDDNDKVDTRPHVLNVEKIEDLYPLMEKIVLSYAENKEAIIMFIFGAVSDLEAITVTGEVEMLFGFLIRTLTIDLIPVWGFLPLYRDENGILRRTQDAGAVYRTEIEEVGGQSIVGQLVLTYSMRYREVALGIKREILH